jgi:O-methyltransferase involved in polyketide biosynthesis
MDLNRGDWSGLARRLQPRKEAKALVMMEGVSPYVDEAAFWRFLEFLVVTLPAGSHVAYDFKFRGIDDELGKADTVCRPFRLSARRDEIAGVHETGGLRLDAFESSADLSVRLLPRGGDTRYAVFSQDGLLRLVVNA